LKGKGEKEKSPSCKASGREDLNNTRGRREERGSGRLREKDDQITCRLISRGPANNTEIGKYRKKGERGW